MAEKRVASKAGNLAAWRAEMKVDVKVEMMVETMAA